MVADNRHPEMRRRTMPKTQTKRARVETAYGQTLAEPVEFDYSYEELQKGDEIPAKEMPDADDLRSFVNQKRNAAARSKAQNEALTAAGIQKPTLEDPDTRLRTMVKVLVAAGNTPEQAEQIARGALGM
jgi:hypothetical protein